MADSGQQITLTVTGMSCNGCSGRVQQALADVPDVKAATVDLASGMARIETTSMNISADELIEIVKDLGYGAAVAGR